MQFFGGWILFFVFEILALMVFSYTVLSFIRNKILSYTLCVLFCIFITLEISSIYLNDDFINYRYFTHMNLNAIEGHGAQFLSYFLIFSGVLVAIFALFTYLLDKNFRKKYFIFAAIASLVFLSAPKGIFNEIYHIAQILNAKDISFKQALKDVGIPPEKYVTPDKLKSSSGKNIIVISIESLEQGFIDKTFGDITPNLTKLSHQWTFYKNLEQTSGANWTSASLYTHQTGVPAFFKAQGNSNFSDATNSRITGLGNILNRAGYNIRYIMGKKEFGGIDDMLKTYDIKVISEKNSLGKYTKLTEWGFEDYDIFKESKLWIKEFEKSKKPFALFVSTLNTHYPNGIYDKRMKKYISKRNSRLEFCVSSVDYLVGDFIKFLKDENLLENTSIFIFPDHLMMGHGGKIISKLKEEKRKLYLLTNVNEKMLGRKSSDVIYQIDLPRLIVNGAEIKTNANFLTDFVTQKDKNKFIEKNILKITSLNHASLDRKSFKNSIKLQVKKPFVVVSTSNFSKKIPFRKKDKGDGIYEIVFNKEMNYLFCDTYGSAGLGILPKLNSGYDKKFTYIHLSVFVKNGKIVATYLRDIKSKVLSKKSKPFGFSKEEILKYASENTK